tara:strand:- start:4811 stop:8404 length:3594 start_codon:yes stop_codon:yes gene_type:complete
MANLIKDFIGMNILVNDPIEDETNAHGQDTNTFGCTTSNSSYSISTSLSESKVLPILLTHRNGPWGYCSWKQIRTGDNAITRRQRKNNKLTFVKAPVEKIFFEDGKRRVVALKDATIQIYDEPAVVSKHQPLTINLYRQSGRSPMSRVSLFADYNNRITFMSNDEVNSHAQVSDIESEPYKQTSKMYLGRALRNPSNVIKKFESLKFAQTVYPPEKYTFKSYTRARSDDDRYEYWRDSRQNRTTQSSDGFSIAINSPEHESSWPLDVSEEWLTRTNNLITYHGKDNVDKTNSFGILWNNYSFAYDETDSGFLSLSLNAKLRPACFYSRRHIMTYSQSVANPSGRPDLVPSSNIPFGETFGGEAYWDTPIQSGKKPFYDTISDYYEELRPIYKDYSIIPEFSMEQNIDFYLNNGITEENSTMFNIVGGDQNRNDSSKQDFYETYSMSDFLKNFNIVVEDHKDVVKPSTISLTCKAVKKFIPYEGFYPAQRTVQIAQTFYDSYSDNITFKDGATFFATHGSQYHSAQALLQPLFAPGVLFNTIKSGVACDFLTYSSASQNLGIISYDQGVAVADLYGLQHCKDSVQRIPFDALLDPEEYLANEEFLLADFHSASYLSLTSSAIWDGQGKRNYKLMVDNFLAEVPEFFLKNKNFTRIVSQEQGNPNFGNAEAGKTYGMRVKMYRSMDSGRGAFVTGSFSYLPPQDIGEARETLTMYSRPSAFGPEIATGSAALACFGTYASKNGYNFVYTPPYYHGAAYADIYFTATESKKYTIAEIFNSASVEYYRLYDHNPPAGQNNNNANYYAMQLDASVNLFGLADPPDEEIPNEYMYDSDGDGLVDKRVTRINVIENANARWAIQTKFECPILNFNTMQTSSMTMPTKGAASVPIGMWHQYGVEPSGSEGVFLQVHNIPKNWRAVVKNTGTDAQRIASAKLTGSLNHLMGFSNEPVKLGEMANSKMLEEAVIAIPFFEENGVRKFFPIPRTDINNAIDGDGKLVGDTIIDMVRKMKKYRLPPPFDFVTYNEVDPFAMYIFEFKHRLSRKDLTDIWQNVSPTIGHQNIESSVSITHELLAHELMGGGAVTLKDAKDGTILDESATGTEFDSKVRWLVFKAKRKAKNNYKRKMLVKTGTTSINRQRDRGVQLDPIGFQKDITYNWPHDHYSLVELVKIDAEVEFAKIEKDPNTAARVVVPITREDIE